MGSGNLFKRLFITCIICWCLKVVLIAPAAAQTNREAYPQENREKCYLHCDKPWYNAGETIWYKAYFYANRQPSLAASEIVLQMQTVAGEIITANRHPVLGATATGNISLHARLAAGIYFLKIYSRSGNQARFREIYEKRIFINNAAVSKVPDVRTDGLSLQFFPESGHFIDRIRTQIAFIATTTDGLPAEISAVVKSDSNTIITSFRSHHDGIGRMSLTPHVAATLFAEVDWKGKKYRFDLPQIDSSGIYLKVANAPAGKAFEIVRSKRNRELYDSIQLVVLMNLDTVFARGITFGNSQSVNGLLQTDSIASGILRFILLNKFGDPIAERLSFVNNGEYENIPAVVFVKRDSSLRAFNSLTISFKDSLQRSFSVAVTDASIQRYAHKESIYTPLLLTADLKGTVYNPAWYFQNKDSFTTLALDNIMLTHGWSKYDLIAPAIKQTDSAASYLLSLSGKIVSRNNFKKLSDGNLNLQLVTEDSSFYSVTTAVKEDGTFKIDSLIYFGNASIYHSYTSLAGKSEDVILTFNRDADEAMHISANNVVINHKATEAYYNLPVATQTIFANGYRQLDTVYLQTKVKRAEDRVNDKYASTLFRTSGKLVLDNISRPYSNANLSVIDYILTNLRTVNLDAADGTFVNRKNFSLQTQKNWKVELFLDETVATVANARSIKMEDIALIKFYEAGFVAVGSQAPGGAIAIYLKKFGEAEPLVKKEKTTYPSRQGYSISRRFYQPDYASNPAAFPGTDGRTTLCWKTFDASAAISPVAFDFFNNDFSKKLSVIVEGFDAAGHLFHYELAE